MRVVPPVEADALLGAEGCVGLQTGALQARARHEAAVEHAGVVVVLWGHQRVALGKQAAQGEAQVTLGGSCLSPTPYPSISARTVLLESGTHQRGVCGRQRVKGQASRGTGQGQTKGWASKVALQPGSQIEATSMWSSASGAPPTTVADGHPACTWPLYFQGRGAEPHGCQIRSTPLCQSPNLPPNISPELCPGLTGLL